MHFRIQNFGIFCKNTNIEKIPLFYDHICQYFWPILNILHYFFFNVFWQINGIFLKITD